VSLRAGRAPGVASGLRGGRATERQHLFPSDHHLATFMAGRVPPKPETIGRVLAHLNDFCAPTADGDFNPADLALIIDYPHVARYFAAAFPSAPPVWPASARPPPVAQLQAAIATVQTEVRTLSESLPKALADIKTYAAAAAQGGKKPAGHLPAVTPPSRPPARTPVPTRPARERALSP
jgi:hypothetical protein